VQGLPTFVLEPPAAVVHAAMLTSMADT
jgi:hypothetical protein